MILAALFAANCLLPPGLYIAPRTQAEVYFISRDAVRTLCWRVHSEIGCEWGYGSGTIHVHLAQGSSEQESCRLRHALGHITDYERTGDPNPRHIGWEYQE